MARHAPVALADVDLSDLDALRATAEGWAQFDTLRARGAGALEPGGRRRTTASGRSPGTPTSGAVDRDTRDLHLDQVRQPRGGRRRPDGPPVGRCWRPTASGTGRCGGWSQRDFTPRNLLKNYEDFLRGLTRETVDAALARRTASSTSSRRSAPTSRSRCWPGCSTYPDERHRPADRLGQRDDRQHRPGLRRRPR